jgi:hypothetical protein
MAFYAGHAFGRERPTLAGRFALGSRGLASAVEGYLNRPRDLGPVQGISGLLNSLGAVTLSEDFFDLHFATGVEISHSKNWARGGSTLRLSARYEEHRPGTNVVSSDPDSSDFRGVVPTDRGTWSSVAAEGSILAPVEGVTLTGQALWGRFEKETFGVLSAGAALRRRWLGRGGEVQADVVGGVVWGDPPAQALFYLGGRGTVPGYGYRAVSGDRYWLVRTAAAKDVLHPWLRFRAFAAAGGVRVERRHHPTFTPYPLGHQVMSSVGLGVGLGWDVLRLDLAKGLRDGGDWEFMVSVRPDLWPWL